MYNKSSFTCCILVLPPLFGLDGVWAAGVCTEIAAVIIAAAFLIRFRGKYHYA